MFKVIFLWILIIFALLQLIQIKIQNSPSHLNPEKEIHAPKRIYTLLKKSCYDCHSYRTHMPWYGYIAPFSFEVKSHIKNGRLAVNFQEWGNYDEAKKQRIYRGIVKSIDNKMPLATYLYAHPKAKLNSIERTRIKIWAQKHIKE